MALRDRPVLAAAAGAACIASSATLVSLADTAPATAATFRCLYALPFLGLLMLLEDRRLGRRPLRARLIAAGAGVFFALLAAFCAAWPGLPTPCHKTPHARNSKINSRILAG